MRNRTHIFVFLALVLLAAPIAAAGQADSEKSQEHKIKAAFLYNFLKFVDWPDDKIADSDEPITIGIIGSKDFIKAFEPVKHKKIKNRNISIKYFEGFEKLRKSKNADDPQWDQKIATLKTCHLLFLSNCDSVRIESPTQIVKALKDSPVLTVGEAEGFLESGGIINFLMEDKKVRFEINNAAAKRAKLEIRSQLLRLAKRVIPEKPSDEAKS